MGLIGIHHFCCSFRTKGENSMNNTLHGTALVEQWRNGGGQDSPAGPLFAAGEFAQADIVNATAKATGCCLCTGSVTVQCC
jgi:hypothetical protein